VPLIISRGGEAPKNRAGEIEFKGVSFSYPNKKDVKILNEVSFTVKKN
jgi:ABC-type multidrug transport system fused ATPase/permease subunit